MNHHNRGDSLSLNSMISKSVVIPKANYAVLFFLFLNYFSILAFKQPIFLLQQLQISRSTLNLAKRKAPNSPSKNKSFRHKRVTKGKGNDETKSHKEKPQSYLQSPNEKSPKTKNFAKVTVTGQNIIDIRSFSIDSRKTFEFIGSYKGNQQVPIFPSPEVAFLGTYLRLLTSLSPNLRYLLFTYDLQCDYFRLSGRSNVGKSSLLNQLTGLNKNIAIEGKTPGRTQSINLFKCSDRKSPICMFVDLPGYGYAKMSKEDQKNIGA